MTGRRFEFPDGSLYEVVVAAEATGGARSEVQITLPPARVKVCRGRMFSPRDYLIDITEWGFADVVGKGLEERHEPIA